jgi:hypothetical protein
MILIDWGMLSTANMFAHIKSKNDVTLDFLRHMIINSLRRIHLVHKDEYGQLVVACDDRRSWRKDFFPYYKANRKKIRDDSGLDWSSIFEWFEIIREELKENLPYPVVHVEKAEADDIIAILSRLDSSQKVLIVSRDHDFKQLHTSENIKQWNFIDDEFISTPEQGPNEYLFEHIVRGDSGDGVPNILSEDNCLVIGKRQKPITAKRMNEFRTMAGVVNIPDEQKRNFDRNKKMIDFTEIPLEIQNQIIEAYKNQCGKDSSKIFNYFVEKKLKKHLENINDF